MRGGTGGLKRRANNKRSRRGETGSPQGGGTAGVKMGVFHRWLIPRNNVQVYGKKGNETTTKEEKRGIKKAGGSSP